MSDVCKGGMGELAEVLKVQNRLFSSDSQTVCQEQRRNRKIAFSL